MNRPPLYSREGCLALLVFSAIALPIALLVYALSAHVWGRMPGIVCGGIAAFFVVMILCSLYTGSR